MKIVGLAIVACLLCASQTNACDADLDKDGEVGISDFLILAAQFGQTCPQTTPEANACSADLNNNGEVEINDFLIFVEQFGQTCPQTTPDTPSGLSIEAGYGRIVLPGAEVQLNATLNGPGAQVMWRQVDGIVAEIRSANALQPIISVPAMVGHSEILLFEVRAEMDLGQQDSDIVWVEAYVPQQDVADLTLVGDFSPKVGWECNQDPVAVPEVQTHVLDTVIEYTTNGIPAHATGQFPNRGNPNTIAPVTQTWRIPRYPVKTDTPTEMATFGITLDGIKLERDTAESYLNERRWSYEALTPGLARRLSGNARFEWLGTDCNNAHVQPTGIYHYHGVPHGLVNELASEAEGQDMILVGYAADGFPFYVDLGHNSPEGSWELRSGTRESAPGGAFDGTFREDWQYVAGSGDLDQCNGRFGITPEFPEGIYHYYLTEDYPYIPRCVWGTPDSSFRRRGGGGGRPPGGQPPPGGPGG